MPLHELVTKTVKKLVTILITSLLTTVVSKKIKLVLSSKTRNLITNSPSPFKQMPCIYYLIQFKKDQTIIWVLIDSDSKVNAMTRSYTAKLELKV